MALDAKKIDTLMDFLLRASKLTGDEDNVAFFEKTVTAVKNAKHAMADNEEKYAYLLDALTRWANQITFTLFREGKLTEDIEKEYRAFEPVKDTTARVQEYQAKRQARVDEITTKQTELVTEQRGIDIFQAVISGMTVEEAKAKMEEYNQKMAIAKNTGRA